MHQAVRYEACGTNKSHVHEYRSVLGAAMSDDFSTFLHSSAVSDLSQFLKDAGSYYEFRFLGKKNQLNLFEIAVGRGKQK